MKEKRNGPRSGCRNEKEEGSALERRPFIDMKMPSAPGRQYCFAKY
jgi:hypothetical protein